MSFFIFNKPKIRKYINFLSTFSSLILIKLGIKTRILFLPILGYILYLITNSNQNLFKFIFKNNKPYLILLEKKGFNEDTIIIRKTFKNHECIGISRKFIKNIASLFLSKDICDNNYQSSAKIHDKSKDKLYKFYDYIFQKIPLRMKPTAILTGNFGYYAEQELFKAARKNNIKGIAIHKECLKTKGLYDYWKYIYSVRRAVFGGTLILVYNDIEFNLQRESKVIDLNKTNIKIIGCPRLDEAHKLRKNNPIINKHQVLMFGFGLKTSLPSIIRKNYFDSKPHLEYLNRDDKYLSWENLIQKLCMSYYRCASENNKTNFLVKLKESNIDKQEMIKFFNSQKKLKNLKVITKGDSIKLLEQTSICIGFNSTAIFEAIARGIPLIIPNFGECKKKPYLPYLINIAKEEEDIMVSNSEEDLEKIIYKLLHKKPNVCRDLSNNKKELLNKWVGNPDGISGERLTIELNKEIS